MKMPVSYLFVVLAGCLLICGSIAAEGGSPAVGATATLATFYRGVSGTVTVLDQQTIRVEHFNYDGGGPLVYFYLGTNDSYNAFNAGIPIDDQLSGSYSDATLTLSLPAGQTLDGYHAISVWCAQFHVNFGSGAFVAPPRPQLTSIGRTNGITSLTVTGQIGDSYALQVSTNLSTWEDFAAGTNADGTTTFSDTNELAQRFYRVRLN